MSLRDRPGRAVAAALLGVIGGLAALVWRARRATEGVPLSPVFGGPRIGPGFPERRGLTTGERPAGEMDDMSEYTRTDTPARSGFDPERVQSDVRAFYERTDDWEMAYRVQWHRGFRLGARLAAPITSQIEQLNLPGPGDRRVRRLRSRFALLRSDVDPRDDVRAWVRTDPETEAAVFVALYGSHRRAGERFVNIAVPLPGANLSTVLRLEHLPSDDEELEDRETTGVSLGTDASLGTGDRTERNAEPRDRERRTRTAADDPGLYLATPAGAFELPMDQRFRVWPVDAPGRPEPVDPRARLVATHEMWLAGEQFLTITYAMWRREEDEPGTAGRELDDPSHTSQDSDDPRHANTSTS